MIEQNLKVIASPQNEKSVLNPKLDDEQSRRASLEWIIRVTNPVIVISILFYLGLALWLENWQTMAVAGGIFGVLVSFLFAQRLLHQNYIDGAGLVVIAAILAAYATLELFWQGATLYNTLGSFLLVFIVGFLFVPRRWPIWGSLLVVFGVYLWVVNQLDLTYRFPISQSSFLTIYLPSVNFFVVLLYIWQAIRLFRVGNIRTRLLIAFVGTVVFTVIVISISAIFANLITIIMTAVVTIILAILVGLYLTQTIATPLSHLAETSGQIAAGDLALRAPVERADEIGGVAHAFNRMTERLQELINSLEERVKQRTRDLEVGAEISLQLTNLLNVDEILSYVVNRLQTEFNFYHTHIYLVEEASNDLVMAQGFGEVGQRLKAEGHRLPAGRGIVGTVAATNQPFLSNNVDQVVNFVRNRYLPETKSELAVPLRKGEQVLGVLDMQSEHLQRFSPEIQTLLQSIANQIATALDNARLLANTQAALQKVERLNRQFLRETWAEFSQETTAKGYHFSQGKSQVLTAETNVWLPPMKKAAREKRLVKETHIGNGEGTHTELAIPLILRNEVIGVLGVKRENTSDWAEEEVSAVEAIANQVALALENARLSEEQVKTIEKLQAVDRLKSEFLTSMSHELRTPLNSIIGFADVIIQGIDGQVSDMALNDVKLIFNSGHHLLALINDILDINKIEAGMMELVREPLDVRIVVGDVLAATSSLLKDKPVELVVNILDNLPEVYADKLRLNQILLNLVSNAIKFTKKGEIVIEADISTDDPHQMFICVSDEGIGIPRDKFNTIFNRFSQADNSTAREYGGTGLGLPICKQLVEMHGGTIGVESEVGVGSKFFFTIPLVDFVVSEG